MKRIFPWRPKSPSAHSPWLATVIKVGELQEAYKENFEKKEYLLIWIWNGKIKALCNNNLSASKSERKLNMWKKHDWQTHNLKLAIIAVSVAIRAAHRVKDCWTHRRTTWADQTIAVLKKMLNWSYEVLLAEPNKLALKPKSWYDKVLSNTASWFPICYKKLDGSQDARRESPDMPN